MLNMKRLTVLLLAFLVCMSSAEARRKKPKAGKVNNDVYTDATYAFSVSLPENWSIKIKDEDDNFRLVMVQKTYETPPEYLDHPDYTLVPRMTIYVGETSISPFEFLDSLLSETFNSDQKKEILSEFEILNDQAFSGNFERENLVTRKRSTFEIGDERGVYWEGKANYTRLVPLTASKSESEGMKSVHGDFQGGIVLVKLNDKDILLFHVICEGQYFRSIWDETLNMVSTLKWEKK